MYCFNFSSKNKKQQVRYEETGIALANANDFEAGLREEVLSYIHVFIGTFIHSCTYLYFKI